MSSLFKPLIFALCWMLAVASSNVSAALAQIPVLMQRVTDITHTLTSEQQQVLEAKLAAFEQQSGSQIAVLMIPTTAPEALEQYSIRVVDAWKLGREKQDDGVLLIIAKDDRKIRIEVGYGLEGAIPDLVAKRIISEQITPRFRQGDYYGGIDQALESLMRLVAGEQLPAPVQHQSTGGKLWDMLYVLLIAAFVVGGILRAVFGRFVGGVLNAGLVGMLVWMLGGGVLIAIGLAIMAFFLTIAGMSGLTHTGGLGGMGSGNWGGGSGSWSGGGGGFGGGGASGNW